MYSRGKYKDAIDTLKQITDEQEDFQDGSAAYYLAQSVPEKRGPEICKTVLSVCN